MKGPHQFTLAENLGKGDQAYFLIVLQNNQRTYVPGIIEQLIGLDWIRLRTEKGVSTVPTGRVFQLDHL